MIDKEFSSSDSAHSGSISPELLEAFKNSASPDFAQLEAHLKEHNPDLLELLRVMSERLTPQDIKQKESLIHGFLLKIALDNFGVEATSLENIFKISDGDDGEVLLPSA